MGYSPQVTKSWTRMKLFSTHVHLGCWKLIHGKLKGKSGTEERRLGVQN